VRIHSSSGIITILLIVMELGKFMRVRASVLWLNA
jgi:hypothetical protein